MHARNNQKDRTGARKEDQASRATQAETSGTALAPLTSVEELIDKHVGTAGTANRERFEAEITLELVGQGIKQAREAKGLTQTAFGALLGVGKAQISKIENATKDVRLSTVTRAAQALGLQLTVRLSEA